MTLIFGNFPETLGMSSSLENSETSIFLHRLVCGSPGLKKFLVRSIKNQKPCVLVFGCFGCFCCCFFCMIWSYIIIFSPPEHRKHHLNLKWGDLIFWFRPTSCTHFATFQHIHTVRFPDSQVPRLTWVGEPDSNTYSYSYRYIPCHERIVKRVGKDVVSFTNLSSQSDNLTDKDVGKKSDSDSWFLFFAKVFQRPMLFWAGFPYCRDHISTCRLFNIGNSATQHNQVAQWPEYTREKIFTQRNPSWQGLVFKT